MADPDAHHETHEFRADLRQVLDIITHSLYSHREVFLRELISNACDALDKLRFEALTHAELRSGDEELQIRLAADEEAGTLTILDNGIGMSRSAIVEDLGTIARSGTREFLAKLQAAKAEDRPELIGQFGVGFYSAFMVAEEITVRSRRAGEDEGVQWKSRGEGEFELESIQRPQAGTEIVLLLREDAKEFLQPERLKGLVRKYSDFIEHPILMEREVEKDGETQREDEVLNRRKAIWLRPAGEITEEEHGEFYKQLARDFREPLKTIHFSAEGTIEFRALLYLPESAPWEQLFGEYRQGLHLYIQRVFVMDDCQDLLPDYLRFVRGIVDSSDLPLNVSRELLQENQLLARIRKNLTGKVLKSLAEMKADDRANYEKFFRSMGAVLKEGVARDPANRDALSDLLLFESTRTEAGEYTTLEHYLAGLTEEQEAIWYITGEDRAMLENAPYLESFRERNQEVLFLTDPVDEFLVHELSSYHEKPLKAVDREASGGEEIPESIRESYAGTLEKLGTLIEEAHEVRLSSRLRESAACLVAAEGALGSHMERLLEKMGQGEGLPESQRILELNPEHPAVQALRTLHERDAEDSRLADFGRLLYDQAVLAEGSRPQNPAAFAQRINKLIAESVSEDE